MADSAMHLLLRVALAMLVLWMDVALALGVGSRSLQQRPEDSAEQLRTCLNEGFQFQRTTWNASIEQDAPAILWVEAMWSSQRPARFKLTLVTQLSYDRLPALINQCASFTGPLAAAVYLPLLEPDPPGLDPAAPGAQLPSSLSASNRQKVAEAVERIGAMHRQMEADPAGCQLDMMLIWEAFDSMDSMLLYPVNSLRNYARLQVKTRLMTAIDVDMLVSSTLNDQMQRPGEVERIEAEALKLKALVLPAFEPTRVGPKGREVADNVSRTDKVSLAELAKHKKVMQFKLKVFPRGHTPTNYPKWFEAKEDYEVAYQRMFEPWYIGHVSHVPFHDSLFRGYGLNKIAHVATLNYYNYSFVINHAAWLVHRPHEDTAVRKMVAQEASDVNKLGAKLPKTALYYKVTKLFGVVKRGMIRGTLNITVDAPMARCHERLAWLPRFPQLEGHPVDPSIFI